MNVPYVPPLLIVCAVCYLYMRVPCPCLSDTFASTRFPSALCACTVVAFTVCNSRADTSLHHFCFHRYLLHHIFSALAVHFVHRDPEVPYCLSADARGFCQIIPVLYLQFCSYLILSSCAFYLCSAKSLRIFLYYFFLRFCRYHQHV